MVKKLKVIKVGKKAYFVDCRLGQVRNKKNPSDYYDFDSMVPDRIFNKIPSSCVKQYANIRGW